jgi:flagellar basal body P-ring formation protein FlgA
MSQRVHRPRPFLFIALLALSFPAPAAEEKIQDLDGIRLAVESFVATETPDQRGERNITVGNLDSRLRLAACGEGLRTFFAPGSRVGSRRTVGVSCQTPKPWTVYVSAQIAYRGEVLVAARALPRGALLSAGDLILEERDLDGGPSGYLTEPGQALGKRTTRPLRLGLPVTSGLLEDVQVVERGQRVWLVAESRSLSVRMAGTALEHGAPGDLIRVQNNESRKVVQGLVGDDGVVRVGL